MKAEDTVIKDLNPYWLNPDTCLDEELASDQARISFNAGIKEVVEWVEKQRPYPSTVKNLLRYEFLIRERDLQAQKKKWRL